MAGYDETQRGGDESPRLVAFVKAICQAALLFRPFCS